MNDVEDRYDVVIYELASRVVDTVIGKQMRLDSGFYNARRRQETGLERVNEHYSVAIVAAGSVEPGQALADVVDWG